MKARPVDFAKEGRRGGVLTREKYGKQHFSKIAKKMWRIKKLKKKDGQKERK